MEQKKSDDTVVRIYKSMWKNIFLSLLSLAIAAVGCYIIMDDTCDMRIKIVSGWLNVAFFGGGGLLILLYTIYSKVMHIPFLIIYKDRVEQYMPLKRAYYTVRFADVRSFRFFDSVFTPNAIAVDYYSDVALQKQKKSSGMKKKFFIFNVFATGAMEHIYADNMTMKGREIYFLLDARLREYKEK